MVGYYNEARHRVNTIEVWAFIIKVISEATLSLEPGGVEQAKQRGGSKVSDAAEILEPLPKLRQFGKPS